MLSTFTVGETEVRETKAAGQQALQPYTLPAVEGTVVEAALWGYISPSISLQGL
jgi:hypothetical protein